MLEGGRRRRARWLLLWDWGRGMSSGAVGRGGGCL